MNENLKKVFIGNKKKTKNNLDYCAQSFWVKPAGKFWKRFFNKKVRNSPEINGNFYKKKNWFEWS